MRTKHSASIFHFCMVVISLVQQVLTKPAVSSGGWRALPAHIHTSHLRTSTLTKGLHHKLVGPEHVLHVNHAK